MVLQEEGEKDKGEEGSGRRRRGKNGEEVGRKKKASWTEKEDDVTDNMYI